MRRWWLHRQRVKRRRAGHAERLSLGLRLAVQSLEVGWGWVVDIDELLADLDPTSRTADYTALSFANRSFTVAT